MICMYSKFNQVGTSVFKTKCLFFKQISVLPNKVLKAQKKKNNTLTNNNNK